MIRRGKSFKVGSLVIWIIISLTDLITGIVKANDAADSYTSWYSGYSDQAMQAWFDTLHHMRRLLHYLLCCLLFNSELPM